MSKFANCSNCGSMITCSCEYQVAIDGTSACDNCVGAYNMVLMSKKVVPVKIEVEEKTEEVIEEVKEVEEPKKKSKNNSL